MDESWLRIILVAGLIAISGGGALLLRRRADNSERRIDSKGLEPGIYFFSSVTCDTCPAARSALADLAGSPTFTEFSWEESPDVFELLGIAAVPATLVVPTTGDSVLYTGEPGGRRMAGDP